ncbi:MULTISPECIES: pyridoxal-phosphate-dependent aminotransferase family protein [Pontibacillus]|uniref:Alanine--glyoxylate aminotransferase family protein n=1 Tax=Pontibacillus chungwhensis TaxID=265426 RepID=A0ABY8UT95_9BACI|nr:MULTISPECIES: alanine--glyoxylate aminotransferase family protein [Pontibacillus]MCD5323145.1 alanine--glyoxylate aminotransferase family protein [Pontibacillus sp. HN14]WIF96533.1 alanine--glyoxylate aminotransferase family protein [Pontibacillus chungwhensis]
MLQDQTFLRAPGPTPVPDRVKHAMNEPMIGHRSPSFAQLFADTSERLKPIFGTTQPVYTLTASGTAALEAAVTNTVPKGEKVIVVVAGAFGDRFANICEHNGYPTHRLEVEWGRSVSPEDLKNTLQEHPDAKAVLLTYNETSTGVMHPIGELSEKVHQYSEALVLVDGVSCIGGVPGNMDHWNLDVLVTGSQKAMMLPPGLSFVSLSKRAEAKLTDGNPSFYLNLKAYQKQLENSMTPYTPAVSLIQGVKEVSEMMKEETLDHVFERHHLMKDMTRAGIKALGLPLLTSEEDASPTVTSVKETAEFKPDELRSLLSKQFGLTLAGGQKELKGKIFRIGHMGYCSPVDILTTLSMIEMGLKQLGVEIELGKGVKAAQEVYVQNV